MKEIFFMKDSVYKLFDFAVINDSFLERAVAIGIEHSSGLGGPGYLYIITIDKCFYYLCCEKNKNKLKSKKE